MRAPRMIAPFLVVSMSVLSPAQSEVTTANSTQLSATSASGTQANVLRTTICEIVSDPGSFDRRIIELRADVVAGLESNALYDKNCESGNKLHSGILLIESADVTWKNRLKEYKKFWSLVQAYTEPKGKRHSIIPDKYTVTATVIGLFDAPTPSRPEIRPGGQLVLRSVRDVVARPLDTSFMAGAEADKPSSERKKPH